jgi:hypothetical protein
MEEEEASLALPEDDKIETEEEKLASLDSGAEKGTKGTKEESTSA